MDLNRMTGCKSTIMVAQDHLNTRREAPADTHKGGHLMTCTAPTGIMALIEVGIDIIRIIIPLLLLALGQPQDVSPDLHHVMDPLQCMRHTTGAPYIRIILQNLDICLVLPRVIMVLFPSNTLPHSNTHIVATTHHLILIHIPIHTTDTLSPILTLQHRRDILQDIIQDVRHQDLNPHHRNLSLNPYNPVRDPSAHPKY